MIFYEYMCTYPWWPILYICLLFLMSYSVHIPSHVDLFSISTTYLWPPFYNSDIDGLFFNLYLLVGLIFTYLWLHVHLHLLTYSVHRALLDGLFCTHTSSCLTYSLQVRRLHDLICSLVNLWLNLYIYFALVCLSLLERYFMTTWPRISAVVFWTPTFSWCT